jgi:hypothetical protein
MTFDTRLVIVALSTFAIVNAMVSLGVWRLWPRLALSASPAMRAAALLQLRMAPFACAGTATVFALFAFMEYEPRDNGEHMGVMLLALSSAAAGLVLLSAIRAAVGQVRTARLVRGWARTAEALTLPEMHLPCFKIDAAFPVVAVVGLVRPRLFISQVVLDACPAEELRAILRHERGHVARHDNLRHLLFIAAPDCLAGTPLGGHVRQLWHDAAEEAADDAAAPDAATRLHLAAALVRVAKLVPPGHTHIELPISALYRGEPLETRVRRLLDPPPGARALWRPWHVAICVLFLAVGIASAGVIQDLVEAAVKFLP